MTFILYKNGLDVWTESQTVDVNSGSYDVYLGAAEPLDTVAFNQPIELGIKLDGEKEEFSPRAPLVASAFALGIRGLYAVEATNGSDSAPNLIGGDENNFVGEGVVGATIGGGGGIVGVTPFPNSVQGSWGTIGGGHGNSASGYLGTVGGGHFNTASASISTVSGGENNTASSYGAIVGGGLNNTASGNTATVGGGQINTASGVFSTIGGGVNNTVNIGYATVGGGDGNAASGPFATVPGGRQNVAGGYYSFAAGYRARADHSGAFVWQDSTGSTDLVSTAPNQFLARAAGGFFFYTGMAPDLTTGISLPAGSGTWTALSSKSSKTNFSDVDTRSYLDRVASLELKKWSYKTEQGVTHVGPMSEDFHAAFGHGPTDKGISGVDADGVALAAIQGLYQLVNEQQAEIERLRQVLIRAGLE